MTPTPFEDLGQRLIALGEAMRNPVTTIAQLDMLSRACGIKLKMRTAEAPSSAVVAPVGVHVVPGGQL